MKKVYLSDAGPKVSPAIYGFWRWEKEDKKMDEIVHFCLDKGINTFDHSDRYGQYMAEKSFGELLAKKSKAPSPQKTMTESSVMPVLEQGLAVVCIPQTPCHLRLRP